MDTKDDNAALLVTYTESAIGKLMNGACDNSLRIEPMISLQLPGT